MTRDLRELMEEAVPATTQLDMERVTHGARRRRAGKWAAGGVVAAAAVVVAVYALPTDNVPAIDPVQTPSGVESTNPGPGEAAEGYPTLDDVTISGPDGVPVAAGTYAARALGPDTVIHLESDVNLHRLWDRVFEFRSFDLTPASRVFVASVSSVVVPDLVGDEDTFRRETPLATQPFPDDFGVYLARVPQVVMLASGESTGLLGAFRWWDVTIDPNLGPTRDCRTGANVVVQATWCDALYDRSNDDVGLNTIALFSLWDSSSRLERPWGLEATPSRRFIQLVDHQDLLVWSNEAEVGGPAAQYAMEVAANLDRA
ncbi:MAG: hypothetical protein R3249_06340 [Nitriliruptorales bacterium]|nr:hypothetical protein [Nitriliruptorales bacterium]